MADLNRLRTVLNASALQNKDNALYQVISEMLTNLIALGKLTEAGSRNPIETNDGTTGDETFVTSEIETNLPNYRKLLPGTNITFDKAIAHELKINSSGGAGSGGMEYLGDYVTPHTYNDGDIVIASDGIAYVCTVNGTTTPPEPWPGIGVAVNAVVDASYWVVSGHAQLINERVMSALANGYVKSTAGEPSTVAIIPVAEGGTGANNASTARVNLGVGNVGTLTLNGNSGTFLDGSGNWSVPPASAGVPQFAVLFFQNACPPGYTRIAAWDGYYVRMNSVHGTGGANTHQHGVGSYASQAHTHGVGTYDSVNHTHGAGSLATPSHNHGGATGSVSISGNTGSGGGHDHTFSGTTGGESAGQMNVDAGSSGNMTRAPHTHGFSGTTASEANHAHSFSGSGTGSIPSQAAMGLTGSTASGGGASITGASASAGALAITGNSDIQNNLPLYIDFLACRKD